MGWQVYRYPHRPGPTWGPTAETKILIAKGMTAQDIAQLLATQGILRHPSWFRFYVNESGEASKIKVGEYFLSARMTPAEIFALLKKGPLVEIERVTIPEGKNMLDVASILEEHGICKATEAEQAMRDADLIRQWGVPSDTLEGYLFPDTYKFRKGSVCRDPRRSPLLEMVRTGQRVLSDLKRIHFDRLRILNKNYHMDDRDIITLASIVEKETGNAAERPRIASVFLNRLSLPTFVPHRLETDPTIIYGCTVPVVKSPACQQFEGRIRKIHLQDAENPYNTYRHNGLPPGPISNPGRAALLAVFQPEQAPYLYFVSRNDGTHQFSVTQAEHDAAVNKYQRSGKPATP